MNLHSNYDNVLAEAIAMYQRLRERGQNGTLARISVEARFSTLTRTQRQQFRQWLSRLTA